MSTNAQNKHPTLKREVLFDHLVIKDLQELASTGAYDHNVLIWWQNNYVEQALAEHAAVLNESFGVDDVAELGDADRQQGRWDAIEQATREAYSAQKSMGKGVDLKGYHDAAKTFFEQEAIRYGGHLDEVAEYIKKALANGETPDVERLARHCYVSYSKMAGAMESIEGVSGKAEAQRLAGIMRQCVENITFEVVGGKEKQVGMRILGLVEKIAAAPEKYIEFKDPSKTRMASKDPWDFEPMHRQ